MLQAYLLLNLFADDTADPAELILDALLLASENCCLVIDVGYCYFLPRLLCLSVAAVEATGAGEIVASVAVNIGYKIFYILSLLNSSTVSLHNNSF